MPLAPCFFWIFQDFLPVRGSTVAYCEHGLVSLMPGNTALYK